MYSQSWSPGWRTIIFLDGSSSRARSFLRIYARARAPGAPPSRPHGDDAKRSPRWETITSVVVASKTFSSPRPPRKRPAPPESSHSRARGIRSGKFISTDSTGMFMQFDTSVSMTSMPSLSGRAPMPPAASSLATKGCPVSGSRPPNAITSRVPELAAGILPGSARTSAPRIVSAMRLIVAVQQLLEGVVAVGDVGDLGAREALGPREQLLDVRHDRRGTVRGEQRLQPDPTEPPRRHLRHEIAGEHVGQAHVAREEPEEVLVQLARTEELGGRDDAALLVELGGVRRHAAWRAAADVLVVAHRARQRQGAPVGEDRHRQRDVGQMRAAVVRVVQQEGVAVAHALGREREIGRASCRERV